MPAPTWVKAHRRRLAALLVLLLLIFCIDPSLVKMALSSLLSPSEKLDYILRSSPTCIAPCWQSITPGRSTEADFLTLVSDSSPLHFANLEQNSFSYPPGSTNYRWYDYLVGLTADALIVEGRVNQITFWSNDSFSLEQVLPVLNLMPSYFAGVYPAERTFFHASLFDESKGIILDLTTWNFDALPTAYAPICQLEVNSAMPIRQIVFVEPGNNDTITHVTSPGPNEAPNVWPGYGIIELTRCFNN